VAATAGTADYLGRFGMAVDQVVGKVGAGDDVTAVDLIGREAGGEDAVAFVVNTPQGRGGRTDGERIRKAANIHHVPIVTTVHAALAAVQGMTEQVGHPIEVRSLQEYHQR
ncbi:MAG: hypothetical protein WAS51_09915, partial [Ilumatobacteraceae bacterium]